MATREHLTQKWNLQRARHEALKQKNWKKLSDMPYILSSVIGKVGSALYRPVMEIFRSIIAKNGVEFEKENVEKVGQQTYLSPSLVELITQAVTERILGKKE